MKFSRLLNIMLAAALPVLGISALFLILPTSLLPIADSGATLIDGERAPLINFSHNGFILWHFPIAKLLGLSCFPAIIGAELILLAGGILLLLAVLLEIPFLLASIMATISALTFFCMLGLDSVAISVISYLPWLLLFALLAWRAPIFILLTALVSWLSAVHLGSFALFNLIIVLPIALALKVESYDWRRHIHLRSPELLLTCALLLPVLPYLGGRLPDWPSYPDFAHLVPDDGVAGLPQALIGPSMPLAHIDRFELKSTFPTIFGWLAFLFAMALPRRSNSEPSRLVRIALFAICAVALADTLLPEQLAEAMPIAALSRLIPGWVSWPIVPLLLGAAITLIPLALALVPVRFALFTVLTIAACTITLARPLPFGIAFKPEDVSIWREFAGNKEFSRVLISPSYNMLRKLGGWILTPTAEREYSAVRLLNVAHQLKASDKSELLPLAVDGLSRTRWFSTGQSGTEWVSIRLERPMQLRGIRLQIAEFKSDFPRGIEVRGLTECAQPVEPKQETVSLIRHDSWQGEVLYTDLGFPYFGGQDHVEIVFPKVVEAQCLLVKQLSSARRFDWSIGEIALLIP